MKLFLLTIMLLSIATVNESQASRSQYLPACSVVGIVESIETRKEPGQGMSEGKTFTYIDITLNLTTSDFRDKADDIYRKSNNQYTNCTLNKGTSTYQLLSDDPTIKIGQCVKGHTEFMADGNFKSGNWLSNIHILDMLDCR